MKLDSKCKKCRRIGEKLFLKGDRCFTQKCAVLKKPYIPGLHGKKRGKRPRSFSEYGQQMAQKQKVKWIYGVSERQFQNYVSEAINKKKDLLVLLERRLDNVVFRMGLAKSRKLARQIVNHGHIKVNNRRVDIPAYRVKVKDIVSVKKQSQKNKLFDNLQTFLKKYPEPAWLKYDKEKLEATITSEPNLDEIGQVAEISKIIEFYSR